MTDVSGRKSADAAVAGIHRPGKLNALSNDLVGGQRGARRRHVGSNDSGAILTAKGNRTILREGALVDPPTKIVESIVCAAVEPDKHVGARPRTTQSAGLRHRSKSLSKRLNNVS